MRPRLRSAFLLAAAALLAACGGDDRSGVAQIIAPNLQIATSCDPAGIRSTLAKVLVDGPAKGAAISSFNVGEQARGAGNTLLAQQSYASSLQVVLAEYVANRTTSPKKYASTQDAVDYLISSILLCGGTVLPELTTIVGDIGASDAGDQTICAFAPGMPIDCRLPNVDVIVQAGPGFFTGLGVLSIQPVQTDPFATAYPGARWSPVWRIQVLPITAQANYPYYFGGAYLNGPPNTTERATVAVCAADRQGEDGNIAHPPFSQLVVSQAVELPPNPILELPADPAVAALLNCVEGSTNYASARTSPFGSSRVAVAGWSALQSAGSALGSAFLPQPAHAASFFFDGGIGGKVTSFESWFAVVAPQPLALYSRPLLQTNQVLFTEIPGNGLVGYVGDPTYELAASTSDNELVPATSCSFTSANPNVATVTTSGPQTLLTFANIGTTTVTATCAEGTGSATVTVNPPYIG